MGAHQRSKVQPPTLRYHVLSTSSRQASSWQSYVQDFRRRTSGKLKKLGGLQPPGISSLDVTRASKLRRLWRNYIPDKGRGERERPRKGGKRGRKGERYHAWAWIILCIADLHLPSPIHFTSTQISLLLAVTIQPFIGQLTYTACTNSRYIDITVHVCLHGSRFLVHTTDFT